MGEVVWCQGFSEPNAGSDLASLTTRGVIDGDELVVTGRKIWSSYAHLADFQELLVRTDPSSKRHSGLTWVICEMDRAGIEKRPIMTMAGTEHFAELTYNDVRLPLSNVVGGLGSGWSVAMDNLNVERGFGLLFDQAELLEAVDHIWLHGQKMLESGAHPAEGRLALDLASLRAERFGLESMIQEFLVTGQADGPSVSILRLAHSALQQHTYRLAIDLLRDDVLELGGLYGSGPESWVRQYLTSFKATIVAGTSEVQRNIVGERVLDLPRGRVTQ
jgi:alkylation response protein AidB-like acyl-CoA dehydrogenase